MSSIGILPSIDISATGLSAMRRRMNAISSNIANAETTRTDEGGPYRRREVIMTEGDKFPGFPFFFENQKSKLAITNPRHLQDRSDRIPEERERLHGVDGQLEISQDDPIMVFDPSHPDANADGYVAMPNVNIVQEMVDLIVASRAYEANLTVVTADKEMIKKALEI